MARKAAPAQLPAAAPGAIPYDVHPTVALVASWLATLEARSGRSLAEWIALIERDGPAGTRARTGWLRTAHGQPPRSAGFLAQAAAGDLRDSDPAAYLRTAVTSVDTMFGGPRAALRPLYDTLLALARSLGPDVRVCPATTIVPLYRHHVFAQLKPATNSRLDLGLALGDTPCTAPLIDTSGLAKKDRITHRIPIEHRDQIDAEVLHWLRLAYDRDA